MGDYKVYIGNIPDDCRERDVEKFFKGFGKIRNIVLKVSVIPPSEQQKHLFLFLRETTASLSLMI